MTDKPVFCVDCAYFLGHFICSSPFEQRHDLVTGEVIHVAAEFQRSDEGKCGPEGKLFEPKL